MKIEEHSAKLEDYFLTRRQFLHRAGMGFGVLSLAALLGDDFFSPSANAAAATQGGPLTPKSPHFRAKAKRVVHIFAQGAPSHVDTWDPKPALAKYDGQSLPGMQGVAKIHIDERKLVWIWTRSTTDWLRLWLWSWLP